MLDSSKDGRRAPGPDVPGARLTHGDGRGTAVAGRVSAGFEQVADALAITLEGSPGGAALAAVCNGELVVDLWAGEADPLEHTCWNEDSLVVVFSGTKGVVATCMLLLIERGLLELDAPVARYWPAFGAAGKEGVLVRHVFSHTAGVPGLRTPFGRDEMLDREFMARRLVAEKPFWPPGTTLAYHGHTFGTLCDELIRRVDGRSTGRFVADELAEPLGLEFWIGLPDALEPRVATLIRAPNFAVTYLGVDPEPLLESIYGEDDGFPWNEPRFHQTEIPSAGGIGTARSLARLYGCLARDGELDGFRLLEPATVELASTELSRDTCAITVRPYAFGAGFELWTELGRLGPSRDAFGHTGSGGSSHGAWPGLRTGFSYAMSELRAETEDQRAPNVLAALYESCRNWTSRRGRGGAH